jgi:hypothetical protein
VDLGPGTFCKCHVASTVRECRPVLPNVQRQRGVWVPVAGCPSLRSAGFCCNSIMFYYYSFHNGHLHPPFRADDPPPYGNLHFPVPPSPWFSTSSIWQSGWEYPGLVRLCHRPFYLKGTYSSQTPAKWCATNREISERSKLPGNIPAIIPSSSQSNWSETA